MVFRAGGISSNGRAPALHAGGTGIDTHGQILYFVFFFKLTVLAAMCIRKWKNCKTANLKYRSIIFYTFATMVADLFAIN